MKSLLLIGVCALGLAASSASAEWLGCLNCPPSDPESPSNPSGKGGLFLPDGLMNPSGWSGPSSPKAGRSPDTVEVPKVSDDQGRFRGNLNVNQDNSDSRGNPERFVNPPTTGGWPLDLTGR